MNEDDLKQIDERLAKTTAAPWKPRVLWHDGAYPVGPYSREEGRAKADADFIAHARGDVPELVAEVRRLRSATFYAPLSRLWSALVRMRSSGCHVEDEVVEAMGAAGDALAQHHKDVDTSDRSDDRCMACEIESDGSGACDPTHTYGPGCGLKVDDKPAEPKPPTNYSVVRSEPDEEVVAAARRRMKSPAETRAALLQHYQRVVNEEITSARLYEDELEQLAQDPQIVRWHHLRELLKNAEARRDQAAVDLGLTYARAEQ